MSYDMYFAMSGPEYALVTGNTLKNGGVPLSRFAQRFTTMDIANRDALKTAEVTGEGYVMKVTVSGHYKRHVQFYQFSDMEARAARPMTDKEFAEDAEMRRG